MNNRKLLTEAEIASIGHAWEAVRFLRSTGPWEQQQNHLSIIAYAQEEIWELIEAVESEDHKEMIQELGDVLLQVFFHAAIAESNHEFTLADIGAALNIKLRQRCAPLFAGEQQSVLQQEQYWQHIKQEQKKSRIPRSLTIFSGIPMSIPPVLRAQKIFTRLRDYQFPHSLIPDDLRNIDLVDFVEEEYHQTLTSFTQQCSQLVAQHGIPQNSEQWIKLWNQ